MSREWTVALQNAISDGLLSAESVVEMALNWMSEADVEEMCRKNDLEYFLRMETDEPEDDEEDDDDNLFAFENDEYDTLRD